MAQAKKKSGKAKVKTATQLANVSPLGAGAVSTLVVEKTNIAPAEIVAAMTTDDVVDLPEGLDGEGIFEKEAPTGFPDQIDFKKEIGRWCIAKYLKTRSDIGPNNSNMYDLEVYDPTSKTTKVVGLWGSTILDTKMDQLNPKSGQYLYIQYIGSRTTSRNQSPAKDYRVAVVNQAYMAKIGYPIG